jgi:ABC-type transport system involved in multi-copper enzyme maturation permease subunit
MLVSADHILALAHQTWREMLRERLVSGALLASVGILLVAIPLGGLSLGQDGRILADLGFASLEVTSVLLVIVAGAQMLPREWERRTSFLVLSKPVSRTSFLLGKAFGLLAMGALLVCIQAVILLALLALRGLDIGPLLGQLPLVLLQTMLVASLAVGFSAFASTPVTLLATLALYVTGHNLDSLQGLAAQLTPPSRTLLTAIGHLLPDFSLLDLKNRIIHGQQLTPGLALAAVAHGLSWCVLALSTGILAFLRREA